MGFSVNSYAKVWGVEDKGNYSQVALSISKKAKDENGRNVYDVEFSDKFVKFVGKAHELARTLKEQDSIKILRCDVTQFYSKEKQRTYINYTVFDAEPSQYNNSNRGNSSSGKQQNQSKPSTKYDNDFLNVDEDSDAGLPFN